MFSEIKNEWNLPMYRMHHSMLPQLIDRLNSDYKAVAWDIETTGLNLKYDSILGFGLCFEREKAYYIDLSTESTEVVTWAFQKLARLTSKVLIHNSMFDVCFVGVKYGVNLTKLDIVDTLIVEHTVNTHKQYYERSLGLKALAMEYTRFGDYEGTLVEWKKDFMKKNKINKDQFSYGLIPTEILEPYCCLDVIVTLLIFEEQVKQINRHVAHGWEQLPKLIRLKHEANYYYLGARIRGLKVDREVLNTIGDEWKKRRQEIMTELLGRIEVKLSLEMIRRLELTKAQAKVKNKMKLSKCRKIFRGAEFNFSSNNHKRILFFDIMGLQPTSKTKTGEPSTDGEFISKYKNDYDICKLLDEYSKLDKGITSFVDGILPNTSEDHPFVHCNFNIAGTVSSRLSTSNINLAQIPSKKPMKAVKKAFMVEDGYEWVAFDYVNEESVLLASFSGEPSMLATFKDPRLDGHCMTALTAFNKFMDIPEDLDLVGKCDYIKEHYKDTWRARAKSLAFGLSYGITKKGLSEQLKCSQKEAQSFIDSFFEGHTHVDKFIQDSKDLACARGYVENRFGARVYLSNVTGYNWRNPAKKNYKAISELKFVTNFVIQSYGAFILYERLVNFMRDVEAQGLDISLICTIYDSVMLRVNKNIDYNYVADLIRKHFTVDLGNVILKTDCFRSDEGRWYSYEDIDLNIKLED